MSSEAIQTSYTKDNYLEGMQTIAAFTDKGYQVVGFDTVINPQTGEPTWYVLMVKPEKKTDIRINHNYPFPQQPSNYIEAIGKTLP